MLGENLRQLRKSKGMTLEELSNALTKRYPNTVNFNKGKLSKWENGREEPVLSSVKLLADFFDVSIDVLVNNWNVGEDQSAYHIQTKSEELIPIVGKIAAGEPNYAVEDILGYMSLPPGRRSADGLIYLEVSSDSMDRKFPVGSYVLIDTQASIENGEVAAVKVNGDEATLKQVKFEDGGSVMLIPQSNNPNHYPVSLDCDEHEVSLIGKAVGVYLSV